MRANFSCSSEIVIASILILFLLNIIDKKKFSDVFAKNVKKTIDTAEPVTEEILKAGTKATEESIKSLSPSIGLIGKEANNVFDQLFTSIFGKVGVYIKWILLTIGVLILIYILYNTFKKK